MRSKIIFGFLLVLVVFCVSSACQTGGGEPPAATEVVTETEAGETEALPETEPPAATDAEATSTDAPDTAAPETEKEPETSETEAPPDTKPPKETSPVTTAQTAPAEEPITTAPETEKGPEASPLRAWFEYGSALIPRDKFEEGTADSIAISMAKNEKEGFELLLASDADLSGLRCELKPLTDGMGHTLTGTVNVTYNTFIRSCGRSIGLRGYVPTAILDQDDPYAGGTFDLIAGRSKTIYVLFQTGADTVPGTYAGELVVRRDGEAVFTGGVSVTVWDIYYSEETHGIHTFGYGWASKYGAIFCGPTYEKNTLPAGAPDMYEHQELSEIYCDYLIDNRMTPTALPLSSRGLLDEKAEKYLDNPRVSLIGLNGLQQFDLPSQYAKAKERGWLDKVCFAQYDEPHEEAHIRTIINSISQTNRFFPTTLHFNALIVDLPMNGQNIIERLAPYSTLHCVKAQLFTGQIAESMLKLKKERGDTILWYVCGDEPAGTVDGLPCIPGTEKRILFWMQYLYDLDGFLMWQTCMWSNIDNIWEEGYENRYTRLTGAGEGPTANGVFLYWHPETKRPVPTLGFEAMRDGIEDYQLLICAETVLGRDAVLEYVKRVTTGRSAYTKDAAVLMQVRNELAAAVGAALAG